MKNLKLFCGACDRPVNVLIEKGPAGEVQASIHDTEIVCLEIGAHCTGSMCPLGAAATSADEEQLGRHRVTTWERERRSPPIP